MQEQFEKLQNLLRNSRMVNAQTLVVDQEFKDSLREKLYTIHINQQSKGGSLMEKIRSIPLNTKFAFYAVAALAVVAIVAGGGVFLFTRGGKSERTSKTLLAANLAVADGDVEIKKSADDRWTEAKQGDTVEQGDSIRTADDSKAVLLLDNGDALRLNASSEVLLSNMDPKSVVIDQVSGESYNRVAKSEENTYTVRAQDVTAQALGTAYLVQSDADEKMVNVYVYESAVKVGAGENEEKVGEMNKAIVDTESKEVQVAEMNEEEYKTDFVEWNKGQDKEMGYEHETGKPVVTIASPANGTQTEEGTIVVEGSVADESALKKIIVNGTIYMTKDDGGMGFDLADGTFKVSVSLNDGENAITVKAYDIYWNASDETTVNVTKKTTTATTTVPTSSFYISSISSPAAGKIYVKWAVSGVSTPNGFKVVWSKSPNPVYPGNEYQYLSEASARQTTITGVTAGTYYVRVCVYNGSGTCLQYTGQKTVTVGEVQGAVNGITLSGLGGGNVKWTVNGYSSMGFKVVWSKTAGPTYPTRSGDQYHYYSDPNQSTDTVDAFNGTGTYYVRVCEYLGGACGVYSNQITVTL